MGSERATRTEKEQRGIAWRLGKCAAALLGVVLGANASTVLAQPGFDDVIRLRPTADSSSAGEIGTRPVAPAAPEPLAPVPGYIQPGVPAPAQTGNGKSVDQADVQRMIDSALKAQDEKRKREEADKKKAQEADGYAIGSDLNMKAFWNNGVWFQTANKDFTFHFGGAGQMDLALYSASQRSQFGPGGVGDTLDEGVNIRRGRLRAEGTAYEVVDFVMELEFFNGFALPSATNPPPNSNLFNTPGPTDFYFTVKKLPWIGNVRVGNQKEPFSFEHLNSYRYLEFLERSLIFDAFVPNAFYNGFNPGIMAFNTMFNERMTWWAGAFKATANPYGFSYGPGGYQYSGRLTGLPIYIDEGHLVHVGVGTVLGGLPDEKLIRLRAHESVRNGPFPVLAQLANTGNLTGNNQDLLNVETAAICGSWTFQGEFTANWITNAATVSNTGAVGRRVGTFYGNGFYVEAMYFLTGEQRSYNKETATFNRVIPKEPFFWVPGSGSNGWMLGKGAWEVASRYSMVDLTNKGIMGGVLHDVTLGINWYLNPNMKLQWNYDILTRGDTGHVGDTIQALGMRMAFDF